MRILIVQNSIIPVHLYGGTERVVWYLGSELSKLGHQVTYLVYRGSTCPFAKVILIDEQRDMLSQLPDNVDVIHFNYLAIGIENISKPYIVTMHGNAPAGTPLDKNTVFVSQNHANRYGSSSFVYNGLDWDDYPKPQLDMARNYFHFLGKAAWRIKNVQGAIDVIKATKSEKLNVLGGIRFNISMGVRFTFTPRVQFYGMVGGAQKAQLLNASKGLIFPVRWHEPFGLAITESLFYGCPVFGTPYGSLPELVPSDVGFLSSHKQILAESIENAYIFSKKRCHDYAIEVFNSKRMALAYLEKYEMVLNNRSLNAEKPSLQQVQTEQFLAWT